MAKDNPKEMLSEIRSYLSNPIIYLGSEKMFERFKMMFARAIFEKDLPTLRYLKEQIAEYGVTTRSEKRYDIITEFEIEKLINTINIYFGLLCRFMDFIKSENPILAVDQIENGEKVLQVIKLKGERGVSLFELIKYSGTSPGKTQRAVDKLTEHGYVSRREAMVFVTEAGKRFFDK